MNPILGSGSFVNTQTIDYSVAHYATSMTVPSTGIGFRLFDPATTFNTSGMQNTSDPTAYVANNGSAILVNSGTWGRTPVVMDFWGGGAPPGVSVAGYVVMHWRGFFPSDRIWAHPQGTTTSCWLSFSGKGFIRVQL